MNKKYILSHLDFKVFYQSHMQGISEPATQGKVVATFEYKGTEGIFNGGKIV